MTDSIYAGYKVIPRSDVIEIVVWGKPRTKNAKKAYARGQFAKVTDDKKTKENVAKFAAAVQEHQQSPLLCGPLLVTYEFVFDAKVGARGKWEVEARQAGKALMLKKPDFENVVKLVNDCLTGVVWSDDAQVCKTAIDKRYTRESESPHTKVTVRELPNVTSFEEWKEVSA